MICYLLISYIHCLVSRVQWKKKYKNIQSENPRVAEMKHVGLITSYAAADGGVQSVEVWERRIVEVQACSESRLVHAAWDSDTPGGGGGGGWRGVCARGGVNAQAYWFENDNVKACPWGAPPPPPPTPPYPFLHPTPAPLFDGKHGLLLAAAPSQWGSRRSRGAKRRAFDLQPSAHCVHKQMRGDRRHSSALFSVQRGEELEPCSAACTFWSLVESKQHLAYFVWSHCSSVQMLHVLWAHIVILLRDSHGVIVLLILL